MKWNKAELLNRRACGVWWRQREIGDKESERRTRLYSKLVTCGHERLSPKGKVWYKECGLAICPACSRRHSERLTETWFNQFRNVDHSDFMAITMKVGWCYDIDETFPILDKVRKRLAKTVENKRRLKSDKGKAWRRFSMTGYMEIDSFRVQDFGNLALGKQQELLDKGFDPNKVGHDFVWEVTIHAMVYYNGLEKDTILGMLSRFDNLVHPTYPHLSKPMRLNVKDYLRYSSKVEYGTIMGNGKPSLWTVEHVREYCDGMSKVRGRQGFRVFVGQAKNIE